MTEVHHQATKPREGFIHPSLDKNAKIILEKAKADDYLFGANLSNKLKTVKSIEKVGLTLKSPPFSAGSLQRNQGQNQYRGAATQNPPQKL